MTTNSELPILTIVIPCYNEEAVLPITYKEFLNELDYLVKTSRVHSDSTILFVDDGSDDSTWDIISDLSKEHRRISGIALSRNRGHQNALLAGLMEAREYSDVTISIDCDGQDDISAMSEMIDAYNDGSEIVYGVRSDRESDSAFKRMSAQMFYRLLNDMGVESVFNHADFRLMSKKTLDALSEYDETNLYLRGLIPLIGYKTDTVEYKRSERVAGNSHYPLAKMTSLALNGITNLSIKPIRIITIFGLLVTPISFIGAIWAIVATLLGVNVPGWASLVLVICFFGGAQMLSLGIIGEYIGKMYLETKHRPKYHIAERIGRSDHGGLKELELRFP